MNRPQQNYGSISSPAVEFIGNPPAEFNNYCENVVTNVYTINSSIKTLENALKSIGTKKDNRGLRNKIHVTQISTNQIAKATTTGIQKLKQIVSKSDKQRQLQVEKLEGNFTDAIKRYGTLQKEVADKQKAHLLVSVSIEGHLPEEETSDQERQSQLARENAFENDMLIERAELIGQIESDVLDINQLIKELGSLVHEQGETIDTIENSIDHATGNIEEGTEQLTKASQYQTRYRKKLLFLIIIGLIIAAILIGVLVSEFKKK